MKRIMCGVLLTCMAAASFSKSFGVIGATFPVREMSFLDFIELKLKALAENGTLHKLESKWQETASHSANRPKPVGLPRSTVKRIFHYDPTVMLTKAILNEQGEVIYPVGTRVNGLESRPNYAPCWLFFNADDEAQLLWAKNQKTNCEIPKLILTGGAVRDAERALNAVIYFDQGGRLSSRFQLQAVPAIITRDGNRLVVTEYVIKESGDVI